MKITKLSIRNTKRIEAFGLEPEDSAVVITGDNRAGKSSILDGIVFALTGKGLNEPVRRGASKGDVNLQLGDKYNLTKTFTRKNQKGTLVVTHMDGTPIASPQTFINDLLGDLSLAFDPIEFSRMKPKAQVETIRNLVGLDTSKLDADHARIYAERTEVNRAVDQAAAVLAAMVKPEVPDEVVEVEQSASELIAKRDAMDALTNAAVVASKKYRAAVSTLEEIRENIEEMERKLEECRATEKLWMDATKEAEVAFTAADTAAPSALSIDAVTQQIANLDANNLAIRTKREERARALAAVANYDAKAAELAAATAKSKAKTDALTDIADKKAALVQSAQMPVEGMTLDEDGVFINGMPLAQLSTAEQTRVSAMVAMRGNPELKLMIIREGALMNRENMNAIIEAANGRDYQVFIERFQEGPGDIGLHIVDGQVSHIDGRPVEESAPEPEVETETETLELKGDAE